MQTALFRKGHLSCCLATAQECTLTVDWPFWSQMLDAHVKCILLTPCQKNVGFSLECTHCKMHSFEPMLKECRFPLRSRGCIMGWRLGWEQAWAWPLKSPVSRGQNCTIGRTPKHDVARPSLKSLFILLPFLTATWKHNGERFVDEGKPYLYSSPSNPAQPLLNNWANRGPGGDQIEAFSSKLLLIYFNIVIVLHPQPLCDVRLGFRG